MVWYRLAWHFEINLDINGVLNSTLTLFSVACYFLGNHSSDTFSCSTTTSKCYRSQKLYIFLLNFPFLLDTKISTAFLLSLWIIAFHCERVISSCSALPTLSFMSAINYEIPVCFEIHFTSNIGTALHSLYQTIHKDQTARITRSSNAHIMKLAACSAAEEGEKRPVDTKQRESETSLDIIGQWYIHL